MTAQLKNRSRLSAIVIVASALMVSCHPEIVYTDLRIYSSPYDGVDWVGAERLKAQHHDHIGLGASRILAYDEAGYDVLSLMDYSGNASLDFAWQERIWPPEQWVPAWALSSLSNIQFFIPNAEEVGNEQHATSPFLTTYIEGVFSSPRIVPQSNQYRSLSEMFDLIRANRGFPCLAHPWSSSYEMLEGPFCTEIYSAFAEAQRDAGREDFTARDHNAMLLTHWDRALERNQQAFGIAVNDHFGPYRPAGSVSDEIRDSGKIIVLAETATLEAYRRAFEAGAFLAVRDFGAQKDEYPNVFSISVDEESAFVETVGDVRWLSGGRVISNNPILLRTELPPNARYVRAEIRSADARSVVYTQAFPVRPVGDIEGNYVINENDDRICSDVDSGQNSDPLHIAACRARAAGGTG